MDNDDLILKPDELAHYGTKRHSGRYPWGSGDDPYQGTGSDFVGYLDNLKSEAEKQGISNDDMEGYLAEYLGVSSGKLRSQYSYAKDLRRGDMVDATKSLHKQHPEYSNAMIGSIIGEKYNYDKSPIGESTIRSLMNSTRETNMLKSQKVADLLMNEVDQKGMIDVGVGVDKELGISKTKLDTAVEVARLNGYEVLGGRVEQQGHPGQYTTIRVLAPHNTSKSEIYKYEDIHQITDYVSNDNGQSFRDAFHYPASMDSKRLAIRYAEDGGKERDGLIEIRRGVKDLSLGNSDYAQVRILVDGTHYLKGMAAYSDGSDMPDGVDVLFNTNKDKSVSKMDALKPIKKDDDNPFGSTIKEHGGQSYYDDPNGTFTDPLTGNNQSLSLINKRSDEGDWSDWSKEMPSQLLSKQPIGTIRKQLNATIKEKQDEYDDIMAVTNPTIKSKLLNDFADDMDANSVELKASSLPGTRYHVILPVPSLKDNEIYAPNYADGTELAVIRYPHAGTFEIPVLTVNNKNVEAKNLVGSQATDAIGINAHNASILSGADFDGDTVQTIPTNNSYVKVKNTPPLEGLKGFDPSDSYGPDEVQTDDLGNSHYFRNGVEYKHIDEAYKQKQMGVASNLITDMTLEGATDDELAAAVRHSMVIIDSYKHHLDYRASYVDNNIAALKEKYQKHSDGLGSGGASTLISRAKNPAIIPERKEGAFFAKDTNEPLTLVDPENKLYLNDKTGEIYKDSEKVTRYVDPKTGEKLYHETGNTYTKVQYITDSGNTATSPAYVKIDGKYKVPKNKVALEQNGQLYYKDASGNYIRVKKEDKVQTTTITQKIPKMSITSDAQTLSSGTVQEKAYADYANHLKSLANQARKDAYYCDNNPIEYSPSAKKAYQDEVNSLEYKVNQAALNTPRERAANLIAASIANKKIEASDTTLSAEEKQKIRQNELVKARVKVGAKASHFLITDKEWEAIQHGAISKSFLEQIMRFADSDRLKMLSTPRNKKEITSSQLSQIKALAGYTTSTTNGTTRAYTNADIARQLGLSVSQVINALNGKE